MSISIQFKILSGTIETIDMHILMIGHYGSIKARIGGQTVKTVALAEILAQYYGAGNVYKIDTGLIRRPAFPGLSLYRFVKKMDCVVLIPGQRSMRLLLPFVHALCLLKRTKLIVIPVGGNTVKEIESQHLTRYFLKSAHAILPQVHKVTRDLKELYGFENTFTMPNFRDHGTPIYSRKRKAVLSAVYLGRIQADKGLDVLLDAMQILSAEMSITVELDVWGQIQSDYEKHFKERLGLASAVRYRGVMSQNAIGTNMGRYDIAIVPTMHESEGVPGAVIDALVCGVPVIASNWRHIPEVILCGYNGLLFTPGDANELASCIFRLGNNPHFLYTLRKGAEESGNWYSPAAALEIFKSVAERDS